MAVRHLRLILGDQLDRDAPLLADADPDNDLFWMAEVREESTHVWSHKVRIALFLSAMRCFADEIKDTYRLDYTKLEDQQARSLQEALNRALKTHKPQKVVLTHPGDYRVLKQIEAACESGDVELEVLTDMHFLSSPDEFRNWSANRKTYRLEDFYRYLRKQTGYLMHDNEPEGGDWNYDSENRKSFGKSGPGKLPEPHGCRPNEITREVLELVEATFSDHPGDLTVFDWSVTRRQALNALEDFISHRLPNFGDYQDAMWTDEPFLYHSRLSSAMNLKLLNPREVIEAAIAAYKKGNAPLSAVEGFVRQILGWREFVRGIYWTMMPDYLERNTLNATQPLPAFYWTGETEMHCLSQAIGQTLRYGYAHHIHRLMVTGLFCLLLGVDPKQVHQWYLAVYVDAIEWVELPNSLGMSQYADDGVMATKPYIASGSYINRMSNYCKSCQYKYNQKTGEKACPFTVLYWDFLDRHKQRLNDNRRMTFQVKNLEQIDPEELQQIHRQADQIRQTLAEQSMEFSHD